MKPGQIFKIVVRLLDIRKAHECSAITFFDITNIGDAKNQRVKPREVLKIAVRSLDVRKAHKKLINIAQ